MDIGWAGSGAVMLDWAVNRLWGLECPVFGAVAGANSRRSPEWDAMEPFWLTGQVRSYLYSSGENRDLWQSHDPGAGHNLFWELLLGAPEGNLTGFGQKGPILGPPPPHSETIRAIHRGILDFTGDFLALEARLGLTLPISGRDAYAPMALVCSGNNEEFRRGWEGFWMEPTSGEKRRVLYHAVSSYQLLEAVLHRLRFHPHDPAVLLLPDFIAEKYPKYPRLAERGFFQEVRLFPYLRVPHRSEEEVFAEAAQACRKALPCPLTDFSRVYVAGAHFYFTLCLIQAGIPFTFFEDAAGMLTRAGELEENLARRYPLHAAIAAKYGLFDGSCPLAREIVCLKSAQRGPLPPHCADFSVERALEELSPRLRNKLVRLFLPHPLCSRAEAILLTQHLANLGAATWEGQRRLYQRLAQGPLKGCGCSSSPTPTTAWTTGRSSPKPGCCGRCSRRSCCPTPFWWGPGWCTPWIPPAAKT